MKLRISFCFVPLMTVVCLSLPRCSSGAWIWTRESRTWRNVKDISKENAREQLQYAESLEKKKDYKEALREYRKTIKYFPTSPEAATAMFKIGVCYEELGNDDKAFKSYQQVLEKYPSFPHPEEVLSRQFAIAKEFYEGKRRTFPLIKFRLFTAKGAAIDYFDKIVETAPYGELSAQAKLYAAELLKKKRKYDEATESYQFIIEHYPKSAAAETALFEMGLCYYEKALLARYDERSILLANTNLRSYLEKYPQGQYVKQTREKLVSLDDKKAKGAFEVGLFYEKKKKFRGAMVYYTEVLQRHPLSAWAVKAEERIKVLQQKGVLEEKGSATGS